MGHWIVAIIFFIFGAVQYNDPDGWLWIPVYWIVAGVAVLYSRGNLHEKALLGLITIYVIGLLFYIPDFISWISGGMPSIVDSMQAESPYIEFVREFFGLVICLGVLVSYWRKVRV